MAFEKAYGAMRRDDWNIVTEMFDNGELLAIEDINKLHPGVRNSRSACYCDVYLTIG
jgi:hypothetical protein